MRVFLAYKKIALKCVSVANRCSRNCCARGRDCFVARMNGRTIWTIAIRLGTRTKWALLVLGSACSHLIIEVLRNIQSEYFRYMVDSLGIIEHVETRDILLELFCDVLDLPFANERFSSWNEAFEFFGVFFLSYTKVICVV